MHFRLSILSLSFGMILLSASTFNSKALFASNITSPGLRSYPLLPDTSDNRKEESAYSLWDMQRIMNKKTAAYILLGQSTQGRKIEAWYFPGSSDKRALVIGGVHGSELSSIEVATALLDKLLLGEKPYYSVIIIPSLFPDNAATAMNEPEQMGSMLNIGRYSYADAVDPNRQMPSPGKAFDELKGTDHIGRPIEKENRLLLQLIQRFRPSRIANLHAIRNMNYGGIYADPRTDEQGIALGYDSDSSLAVEMAVFVRQFGGNVNGNYRHKQLTALYYKDPQPVEKGRWQKRNMTGSLITGHRGSGVSLGTWGTTAIADEQDSSLNRDAMRVITLEFPGAKRPSDHPTEVQQRQALQQLNAFTESIYHIFLGDHFVEEPGVYVI